MDSEALGYFRVHDRHKTIRTALICGTIAICVVAIAWAAVRVSEKPPWLLLLIAFFGPSPIIVVLIATFRRYVKQRNERVRQLEKRRDPHRTSSGLESNGSSANDL